MTMVPPQQALIDLGFTDLEANAYCALVAVGPTTAYRVAKAIGKANANTYQALAALARRGAVESDDGNPRIYRAVEPGRLLRALDEAFQAQRRIAEAALARLGSAGADERLYQIRDLEALMAQARSTIEAANEILLFDLFPAPLAALASALDKAVDRGVLVSGLVYETPVPMKAGWFKSGASGFILGRWPGQQLTLIADAARHVTGLISENGQVRHGFWSESRYLACLQHSGLAAELRVAALGRDGTDTARPFSLLNAYPQGLRALIGPR